MCLAPADPLQLTRGVIYMYAAKVEAQRNICAEDKLCMSCAENTFISIACFYQAALSKTRSIQGRLSGDKLGSHTSCGADVAVRHLQMSPLTPLTLRAHGTVFNTLANGC